MQAHAQESPIDNLWRRLEETLAQAASLARQVAENLSQGASAAQIVPLLRREADLTLKVRRGIGLLGRLEKVDAERRDGLARRLEALLSLEEANRQLLTRRGVRLNARPHRHRPLRTR